jgi:NAD(P)-dependent dehydrogenase (short-subunit alcohol dehydrogenase family)
MLDALALKVKRRGRTITSMTDLNIDANLSAKTAIVTGATGGIGKEIARGLVKLGATVIVGARNPSKGEQVVSELKKDAPKSENVQAMVVDVSSVASIKQFAEDFKKKHDALHILVNNAGAWFTDRRTSPDGVELTFATNVVGPYLMTKLFADSLEKGASDSFQGRVVNVVSSFAANYDGTDVEWSRRKFDGFKQYAATKQALRMVTWLWAQKLEKGRVAVNAAAPGFVKTDFNQNASGFTAAMINISAKLFAVTPAKGADTPLWVAAAKDVEGQTNKYFDKRKEQDGKFREAPALAELEKALEGMISGAGLKKPAQAASSSV